MNSNNHNTNNNLNNNNNNPYRNDYPTNQIQLPGQYSAVRGYDYTTAISRYQPYGMANNNNNNNNNSNQIQNTQGQGQSQGQGQGSLSSTTITPSSSSIPSNLSSTIQQSAIQQSTSHHQQSINQEPSYHHGSSHSGGHYNSNHNNNNNRSTPSSSHYQQYNASKSSMAPPFQSQSQSQSQSSYSKHNEFGIANGHAGASLRRVDWSKFTLPEFQKNFYRESPSVSLMKEEEVQEWRHRNRISVIGENIPKPIRTFEESGFPSYIMAEIKREGFEYPTPIQSQGWPMAMSGRDVVGIAETGSGKTLAFLLPSIVHINAQPLLRPGDGPIVLIIAPTRELAIQINEETKKFASSSRIKHTCVYGGIPRREQGLALRNGVEICICTPGRLLDFLENKQTNLRRVTYLVIDEADRLLDLGFEPQLQAILSQVRPDRQILMWSATWPKEVRALANSFMNTKEALQVAIGSFDTKANHDVLQIIEVIESEDKQRRLFDILNKELKTNNHSRHYNNNDNNNNNNNNNNDNNDGLLPKVLVFISTKVVCNKLASVLRYEGWPVTAIHGDKEQNERDYALKEFKNGKALIMLATDVASRGIHIDDITLVINFDFPTNIEDYVHRIGRTGRCGKKGKSISFFTKNDSKRAAALIDILTEAKQAIPPSLLEIFYIEKASKGGGHYNKNKYQNHNYNNNYNHNNGHNSSSHNNSSHNSNGHNTNSHSSSNANSSSNTNNYNNGHSNHNNYNNYNNHSNHHSNHNNHKSNYNHNDNNNSNINNVIKNEHGDYIQTHSN